MKSILALALVLSAATAAFADHTAFVPRVAPAPVVAPAAQPSAPPYVRGSHHSTPRRPESSAARNETRRAPSARPYLRGQAPASSLQS